ncbi:MAG: amylo-alpha-1,6-glucosidase [Chloroflexi bacterium]|nr:amylo-alpha-1,6-glucosidase [Chloroflexota bacterium]
MLDFGRGICGDLDIAGAKEWLITNGIGGFAAGTVAGVLTRRYHGLLIAALAPPLGRTLLVTKFDETATYDGHTYPLFTNRWADGTVDPAGHHQIERFRLDGSIPIWTFACADALLEKRIWMQPGANTTYVQYQLSRASAPLELFIKNLVNYRDYHGETHAPGAFDNSGSHEAQITPVEHGLQVVAFSGARPYYLLSDRAMTTTAHEWYTRFFLSVEAYRGLGAEEDHLYAGNFQVTLHPGETVAMVVSMEAQPILNGEQAHSERQQYERALVLNHPLAETIASPRYCETNLMNAENFRQLVLAADQFIVARSTLGDLHGRTVIAGYPWFSDWGRDTMISLPGLTLVTGRSDIARRILLTFAGVVDHGLLPNRFPDAGEIPEYNTVDATLWYFEAIRAYYAATGDKALLQALFPVLQDIILWHQQGTRYHIHVDPADGLMYAGEPGVQLTWMDAKVGDWVVTPRIGKPVEINALWFNALRSMADFATALNLPAEPYATHAEKARNGFTRFWNNVQGYCYDIIDGPGGNDASLRPNQIFAVSLPHSPLAPAQQQAVVDICARRLLTSHGLRSLAPEDPAYIGHYGGDQRQRDGAYHQGTIWAWLIGPFISAHLRVYQDEVRACSYLGSLLQHLADHGVGSISEIFDGDVPFTPRGCFAQAWSVAEALRAWQEIATYAGRSQQ